MADAQELALIKSIIADGFDDLEAISFEMDIPMATLMNIKRQVLREKSIQARKDALAKEKLEQERAEKRARSLDRIVMLRRNYELVYNGINAESSSKKIPVEIPDNPTIEDVIKRIECIIEETKDRRARIGAVLKEINGIKNEDMSLEQIERITSILMNVQLLPELTGPNERTLNYTFITYKKIIIKKLVAGVKTRAQLTNDIEGLQSLARILSTSLEKVDYIAVSPTRMNIQSKISKLQTEKRNNEMENDFSEDIRAIIRNLISSEINDTEMCQAIENEVQRRILNNTNRYPGFNTPERQKVQVYYKVVKALERLAMEFPVQRAEKVMERLEKYFGMGFEANFRAVINNYIERNEFVAANYLCDRYCAMTSSNVDRSSSIARIKGDVTKAEIGQIILKGIQANASDKAREQFFEVIERRMKQHGYSYSLIPLGRTRDGTKKITLQDIWGEDIEKRR